MTTLLIATTGGHLTQLADLAARIPAEDDEVWVTHAGPQSESMLVGREVEYVPYVGVRDIRGVARCLPFAHGLLRRRRIRRAVSTGSGIALGFLPYLAARGVECHYIESATRVSGPSLTGRILRWTPGVLTYTQHRAWSDWHWRYGGNVFDSYQAVPGMPRTSDRIRVVVTLGAATGFPFRRLVESLAKLLAPGGGLEQDTGLPVDVLWQTSETPVDDLPLDPTPVLPAAVLAAALARADIVVSHAGTGSALANLAAGRFAVMVPRSAERGEAGDDHQHQLARELAVRGLAMHREPTAITPEDLLATMSTTVRRASDIPAFGLMR